MLATYRYEGGCYYVEDLIIVTDFFMYITSFYSNTYIEAKEFIIVIFVLARFKAWIIEGKIQMYTYIFRYSTNESNCFNPWYLVRAERKERGIL